MKSNRKIHVCHLKGKSGWWLFPHVPAIGPYSSKKEAAEALRAHKYYLKYQDEPGFVTSEKICTSDKVT